MTTPGLGAPDGAITGGDVSPLNGLSESAWRASMGSQNLGGYREASASFLHAVDSIQEQVDVTHAGMLDLADRVDLLESAPAYGQRYMSRSWNISGNARKWLPFDSWIGPHKDVSTAVNEDYPGSPEGIAVKPSITDPGGLWRADLHLTFDAPPTGWFGSLATRTIKVYLSVLQGTGFTTYSERRFDLLVSSYGAESASFSATFVLPDNATRSIVCASVRHDQSSSVRLRGGTVDSALSVNKWSIGTQNQVNIPSPADGGTL